jgi:mannosyltransferase OCH1-like enzyme
MIPKKIFQTHKSINYILSKPKIYTAINTWKKHKDFEYYFFTDELCEKFIKENFHESVYQAYNRLPLAVMKADLWRYCVIYHYGGIYADTDTICKAHPNIFINHSLLTIVPENNTHLCQWIFSAPKGSPILKNIIDLSVKRILSIAEIKGEHIIHYLTGPGLFTDGIEEYLIKKNYPVFSSNRINYFNYPKPELKVFNMNFFHKNLVIHLFTGQDSDGWCKERNEKLI